MRPAPRAGAAIRPDLLDDLLGLHLARVEPDVEAGERWSFVHGLLCALLEDRAREHDRLADHHAAAAATLARLPGADVPERLGRHLLAAGRHADALVPLRAGFDRRTAHGDFHIAAELAALTARALDTLGVPADAAARIEHHVMRAEVAASTGHVETISECLAAAEAVIGPDTAPGLRAKVLHDRGTFHRMRGELEAARAAFVAAAEDADAAGDVVLRSFAQVHVGATLNDLARTDEAVTWASRALEGFEQARHHQGMSYAHLCLAFAARNRGEIATSRARVQAALAANAELGSRRGVADCENALGELARHDGDLEAAERHYRRSLELYRACGVMDTSFPLLNLGLTLLDRGRPTEARPLLEEGFVGLERTHRHGIVGLVHVLFLRICAAEDDWLGWDRHIALGVRLLDDTGFFEPDIAHSALLAGDTAREAGHLDRAMEAWALARAQYRALGRPGDAAQAERRMMAGEPTERRP